jgi:tetratricopeptide (TPR) repeat protein
VKSDQDGKFQGDSQERLGENAEVFYTPRAAIACFTRALEAAQHLSMVPPAKLYRARGHAYEMVDEFERARDDYEHALRTARTACDGLAE